MKNQIREHLSDKKLSEIEEEILKEGLLKLTNTPKKTFSKRRETKTALWDIFDKATNYSEKRESTLYVKGGKLQCSKLRRSQGDLFRIIKYYYPNTTFKEFRAALFELANEGKIQATYCPDIQKRVFIKILYTPGYNLSTAIYNYESIDEFGLTLSIYKI